MTIPEGTMPEGVQPGRSHLGHHLDVDEETPSSSNLWQITVADNGSGFDEKYSERIFTMFQRVHSGQDISGTGIGLAVCRRVVELHRGTITARSQSAKGTTFFITLPHKQS